MRNRGLQLETSQIPWWQLGNEGGIDVLNSAPKPESGTSTFATSLIELLFEITDGEPNRIVAPGSQILRMELVPRGNYRESSFQQAAADRSHEVAVEEETSSKADIFLENVMLHFSCISTNPRTICSRGTTRLDADLFLFFRTPNLLLPSLRRRHD